MIPKELRTTWMYLKILLALFLFTGAIVLPIYAFLPMYDSFGNAIEISKGMKVVVSLIGILCLLFSFYLCIPSLFHRGSKIHAEDCPD